MLLFFSAHGFHAIVQCACQDMGESIIVQGYMAHLGRAGPALSPGIGGPFDVPDKNAGKATIVSDASTPGF